MKAQVTTEYTLEEYLTAPVSKGQRLGTLTLRSGEQILAQIPLVAATTVERLSFWDLLGATLRQLSMAK